MTSRILIAVLLLTAGCAKVEIRRTLNPDGTGVEEKSMTLLENAEGALSVGLQELLKRKELTKALRTLGPEAGEFIKKIEQQLDKGEAVQSRMQYTSTILFQRVGDTELIGEWPEDLNLKKLQEKFGGEGMDEGETAEPQEGRTIPMEQISLVNVTGGGFSYQHRVDTTPVMKFFDELGALLQDNKLELEHEGLGFAIPVVESVFDALRTLPIQLQVTMPGLIVKSNAHKVKGRTAIWNLKPLTKGAKPLMLTAQCGAPAKESRQDVARYQSFAKAAAQQRREVVKFLDGVGLDKALKKWAVEVGSRRQEGETKSCLGAIRSSVSIYYGKNEGMYPDVIDGPPFIGRNDENYMVELPEETVTGSRRVQYLTSGQTKEAGDGKGGWLYQKDSGEVWLNVKGRDSKGIPYFNY